MLTSYELVLAILFRWRAQSCICNIVWLWRSHVSGHGPDHHTLATWYCANAHIPTFEPHSILFVVVVVVAFVVIVTIPFVVFAFYFHPWKCSLLSSFTLIFVVSIFGNEGHHSSSAFACLAGTITLEVAEWYVWYFFGWRMARWCSVLSCIRG